MIKAPFIIGLTGNIATGKSVVGHMLANSGGLEIDADVVANRLIYPSGAAYRTVIEVIGEKILENNGMISRRKLAEIVFSDQDQLEKLEALLHPAVTTVIQDRIRITTQPFVVVEAVKLLESDLVNICDAVWVSYASQSHQMERLLHSRNMTEAEAISRVESQSSQYEKLQRADVVINTEDSFMLTWQQVQNGLNDTIKSKDLGKTGHVHNSEDWTLPNANVLIEDELESLLSTGVEQDLLDWYALLGSSIILPFMKGDRLKSLLLWDNWNFTTVPSQWLFTKRVKVPEESLFRAFEWDAKRQQSEIAVLTNQIVCKYHLEPEMFGYTYQEIEEISYQGWLEAAQKSTQCESSALWIKFFQQPVEAKDKLQPI